MPTTVVNKHHKVPYDTYIGRGSDWGNPFGHLGGEFRVETRDEAVQQHFEWIFTQRHLLARLKELKGKVLCCYCHPQRCHGHTLAQLADTTWWRDDKLFLECSSKGDIRFSAFGAAVEIFGQTATIEEHYQLAKRFIGRDGKIFAPKSVYDVKGKRNKTSEMTFSHIVVDGLELDLEWRDPFYKWMWLQYLDQNPHLVEYAAHFDDFNDIFKGKSIICQADCIRQYIQQGRESLISDIEVFCYMIGADPYEARRVSLLG